MSSPRVITPKPRRRSRWLFLFGCVVVIAAGAYLWRWYVRPTPAQPPSVAIDGLEEEVRLAISKSRERVVADPTSTKSWGQYGMVLQAHSYNLEADTCFRVASGLDNRDPRWPYYLGLNALLHDSANALPFLRKAHALSPRTATVHSEVTLRLAEALVVFGELSEAEALFREQLAVDPMGPRANYGLALLQVTRGDARSAEGHLQLASTSPFTRKKATALLAAIGRKLGKEDAAIRYQREVATLPEDLAWADRYIADYLDLQVGLRGRFAEADRLKSMGRQTEAAKHLITLAESQPNCQTYLAAGEALAELRDFAAAEQYIRACLTLDPSHIQANYFLALTLYYQAEGLGDYESSRERAKVLYRESAQAARRCLEKKPDHGMAHQFLGRALMHLGKKTEAIQHLKDAIACQPEVVEAHIELSEALMSNLQWEEAAKAIAEAEHLLPKGDKRLEVLKKRLANRGES